MEIKFKIDIKTVRKAFAILEMDIPSDEEIEGKLSNKVFDLSGDPDMKDQELGVALIAMAKGFE